MADVTDSKSVGSDTVRVQVPLPAPKNTDLPFGWSVFLSVYNGSRSSPFCDSKTSGRRFSLFACKNDVFKRQEKLENYAQHCLFNSEAFPLTL